MSTETASGPPPPGPAGIPTRPARDTPVIADLVSRASHGDQRAWDAMVERYAQLIWSICRRHRLDHADTEDVGQSVWLHLVDQLDKVRNPAALPGWLATTTKRECIRVLRTTQGAQAAGYVPDIENVPEEQTRTAEEELLVAERNSALCEALTDLSPAGQQLMTMLAADPPVPYAEISARLGIPVGSIGPTRARCLDRLRRHPAITALVDADSNAAGDRP
jgi:RNA polymerase sigma factor (sigma-70 family)